MKDHNSKYSSLFSANGIIKNWGTKFTLGVLLCFVSGSCEKYVEVDLPKSQLLGVTVFENAVTANAALANVYARLRQRGILAGSSGLSVLMGSYADELISYSNFGMAQEDFFENALLPSDATVAGLWNTSYNYIYSANAIIEGVKKSTTLSPEDKDQLIGEALFIRALVHFYLVNLFGEVPYITITDYKKNTTVSRNSINEVYDKIIGDLVEAKKLLPEEYLDAERVRPNKWVAAALLSRVYLYNENWESAEAEASLVLNNMELYSWEEDLEKVFLKGSTSTLWQFSPGAAGINSLEGRSFIFESGPPPSVALSEWLLDAFEPGDKRRLLWVGSVTEGEETWCFSYKYKESTNTGTSKEYSIIFRLAELYLIRAEARAQQNNFIGALEDLNKLRNRAGLEDLKFTNTSSLLEAIFHERQVALFTEFGHRWFDLKRTGRSDTILGAVKPGWDPTDILLPIPEKEILLNPNLAPQNPGY